MIFAVRNEVSGGKTQCTPSYVPKTCLILFFIYQRVILLQLYGVLPNLLRAHYVKTWFSANFWATSEKQRLSSKRTEWTGLTFCLSSLTIYNPWQILQGGGLVTFQGELLHDSLSFYHMFSSLHLQNAGFAISSAEKRSIHRTEFHENDPISSL